MSAQRAETPRPAAPSPEMQMEMEIVGGLRDALLEGRGFPGDREAFEVDLQHAREASLKASPETDLDAVAAVVVDYRGRIRLYADPEFDIAVQEGIELAARLKREVPGQ